MPFRGSNHTPRAESGLLRRLLLALLLFGTISLLVELAFIEHTDSRSQWIPFIVLTMGLISGGWIAIRPGPRSIRVFQVVMLVFVVTGVVGIFLHNAGNVAFERELAPGERGFALIWRALHGATPTLAPGAVTQLGLIGLILAYRHPALGPRTGSPAGPPIGATRPR